MSAKCNNLKNIVIIGTGGTITGVGEKGKTMQYKSGQIRLEELVSQIPEISNIANIKIEELLKIDSCDLEQSQWLNLANFITTMSKDENVDGIVLTHGTDTLEETAFFLNLTAKTHKPIVITGSMRPSTSLSPDGPFNLFQAVALAQSNESVGKGVLVNFSDSIYGARDVQKINTYRTSAFGQKDLGCFGFIRDNLVYFYNSSTKKHTLDSEFDLESISTLPQVGIAYFYAGADESVLDYLYKSTDGIVIAGAGCGGCSTKWNNKIRELADKGFPIVRSSRVSNGLVTCEYNNVDKRMEIYSDTLSPHKARILLSLALTKTRDIGEISKIFEAY